MFLLEHRFYGYSQPFENHNTSNLRYLSAEQAIADIAYFIENMNREHHLPERTKWIVFGCSYAGSLAAWVRIKYPHLVFAAYASSAPLLAKADFKEYYIGVEEALESYDKKCVSNIKKANSRLSKMIKSKRGRNEIKDIFKFHSASSAASSASPLTPPICRSTYFFSLPPDCIGQLLRKSRTLCRFNCMPPETPPPLDAAVNWIIRKTEE